MPDTPKLLDLTGAKVLYDDLRDRVEEQGQSVAAKAPQSMVSDAWTQRTWTAGEYCIDNNKLWKCLVDNSERPSEGANWTVTSINEIFDSLTEIEVTDIKNELTQSFDGIVVNYAKIYRTKLFAAVSVSIRANKVIESGFTEAIAPRPINEIGCALGGPNSGQQGSLFVLSSGVIGIRATSASGFIVGTCAYPINN